LKKTSLILFIFFLPLFLNICQVEAQTDIRGHYSGSYTIVVTNCTGSDSNGNYNASLSMNLPTQSSNTFSGTAGGTLDLFGTTKIESIQLSGTITETGQISGTTSHTFLATGGEGAFTGQLTGDFLTIENAGHDTYGETHSYVKTMVATFTGNILDEYKLTASDGFPNDMFGSFVSISGDYAIVGAYGDDDNGYNSGSAYVFERSGSSWTQVAKLTASDGAADDNFGFGVSISGDYAIVGAYGDDDNEPNSGSAYIFERSGRSWTQVAKLTASDGAALDGFGLGGVSISGDYAIVGAHGDDDNGSNSGSAYIFERSGRSWTKVAKLTTSDGAAFKLFGVDVSISRNYAVVGASGDDNDYIGNSSGSAYVFERSGNSWTQVAKLTASDGAEYDAFGHVSISGDYAIVGAMGDNENGQNSGSAYIFERIGSSWTQVAKLTASDGAAYDHFGSVSISGDYAIVGAYGDDDRYGYKSGSAYIFKRSGSSWTQVAKLTASDGAAHKFGIHVSISGDYAIVGTFKDYNSDALPGSAYIYNLNLSDGKAMPWIPLLLLDD
jgi:hypothetical protein